MTIDVDALLALAEAHFWAGELGHELIAALRQERERADKWEEDRDGYANLAAEKMAEVARLTAALKKISLEGCSHDGRIAEAALHESGSK